MSFSSTRKTLPHRRLSLGIRLPVLLMAILPAILVAIALATFFIQSRTADLEAAEASRALAIVRQLGPTAEYGLFSGNREVLLRVANAALSERDVIGVTLFDQGGRPLVQSGLTQNQLHPPKDLGTSPRLIRQKDSLLVFGSIRRQLAITLDDYFATEQPLPPAAAPVIGTVALEMSTRPLAERKERLALVGLGTSLGVLLITALLSWSLGGRIARPLLRMVGVVEDMAAGNRDIRVPEGSPAELGRLERGINTLATALAEHHRTLESRIEQATRALSSERDVAERSAAAKTRFLAAASHDLRQPMHALSLFASEQNRIADTPAQQKLASQTGQAIDMMRVTLDALLDISRLDMGSIQPQFRPVPLASLFNRLAATYQPLAAEAGLQLRFRASRSPVTSDPALLERLLGNLIANALRYTPAGRVLVGTRRLGGTLRIEVWDSGIGIAPEHLDNIFEEFYQVGNEARESQGGMGLGLSICRRLAQLLSHTLTVHSIPGRGSVFRLTLPLADLENTPPADPPIGECLLVLSPTHHQELCSLLESWDYACHCHTSPASFDIATATPPVSACIIGQQKNTPRALEWIRIIREQAPTLPVVLYPTPSDAVQWPEYCHSLGAPPRPAKLRALLQRLTQLSTAGDGRPAPRPD